MSQASVFMTCHESGGNDKKWGGITFLNRIYGQVDFRRAFNNLAICGKPALMTRALQVIALFVKVHFATKMGAFT